MTACWDVPPFILFSWRSRSVDICPSLAYATSSDAYWCRASVSIDTKGKLRFCHCAKPQPAIFVSQLFYALYTRCEGVGERGALGESPWRGIFFDSMKFWRAGHRYVYQDSDLFFPKPRNQIESNVYREITQLYAQNIKRKTNYS